jgi:hypothetical protein
VSSCFARSRRRSSRKLPAVRIAMQTSLHLRGRGPALHRTEGIGS